MRDRVKIEKIIRSQFHQNVDTEGDIWDEDWK